ncbi:MAG: DUF1015 family protein [Acidimicrobiales bacterium]
MPGFHPFPGLRYTPGRVVSLGDVVCPPYDVISEDDRAALLARSSLNMVGVELPRAAGDLGPYQAARRLLDAWRDAGILARDRQACFYGYRMSFTDPLGEARSTVGAIGALELSTPGSGILPHEETTPKAKTDRLELLRAARTNVSPIWVLSPASGLAAACAPPDHARARAVDPDGVVHELWPITGDDEVSRIHHLVAAHPVLVADGHHRYEVALTYQAERAGAGAPAGDHDGVMALVVELAGDQLAVQPIHRLLGPMAWPLEVALGRPFELIPTGRPDATILDRMQAAGALAVVTRDRTWLARPRPETEAAASHDLDSSRLDVALSQLGPVEVSYQHGWDLATAAVERGDASAAVLVRPATVDQIAAIGRGGRRMPAKTTFFWPKPRTGMVVRELIG